MTEANEVSKEIDRQFKIMARKKLYFAIGVAFRTLQTNMGELAMAVNGMKDAALEGAMDSVPDEARAELAKTMLEKQLLAIRPIYCLSQAVLEYKRAFGEYPEFVKFLEPTEPMEKTEEKLKHGVGVMKYAEEAMAKHKILNKKGPSLQEIAFGDGFIKACELVKVKGE